MRRQDELRTEHKTSITEHHFTHGKLLDGTKCIILLDITFCLNCPSLHSLPTFVLRTKNNLLDDGQYVGVLFVIPVIINLHVYIFEVYTLVFEIHDNVNSDGNQKHYVIEGVISTRESYLHFLNRFIPFFPMTECGILKYKKMKVVRTYKWKYEKNIHMIWLQNNYTSILQGEVQIFEDTDVPTFSLYNAIKCRKDPWRK